MTGARSVPVTEKEGLGPGKSSFQLDFLGALRPRAVACRLQRPLAVDPGQYDAVLARGLDVAQGLVDRQVLVDRAVDISVGQGGTGESLADRGGVGAAWR